MIAMFNETLRIWSHIILGLCIIFVSIALGLVAHKYFNEILDAYDAYIEKRKMMKAMKEQQKAFDEINKYRAERYYREREPHGN